MAQAQREHLFPLGLEDFYNLITDYTSYPSFVEGVEACDVLDMGETGGRVRFEINMIKKISYILALSHERPRRVSWELESGEVFKKNSGSWHLHQEDPGATRAIYSVDIEVKGFFPGARTVVKMLTEVRLPAMLEAYEREALRRVRQ